jgi:hypothetical protein
MKAARIGLAAAGVLAATSLAGANGDERASLFRVATRMPRSVAGASDDAWQRLPTVTMAEGWGCVGFDSEVGRVRQCWDAGPSPRAWVVPWLKDRVYVARDRVCEHDVSGLTFRCWHRPQRGESRPRELPASWQWLNPHRAGWDDVYNRGDRLDTVFMGGTFACLRTTKDQGVFCLGDDRFGQLGSSARPDPKAGAGDPAFVRGLGREVAPVAGIWHACALAAPRGTEEIPVVCWGRGDHGQLGAPAPDTCLVDGRQVPCARTPVAGPSVADQMAVLGAGDLFTCITDQTGIRCWGASRDGLFGVRGSCPASLRRAWPTQDGPVPAPNASCTATPVALPGTTGFDSDFTVLPRQICYSSVDGERCLSGVPKPRDDRIGHYIVSPGSDASACGMRGDKVFCWGEKYARPGGRLDQPLPVVLQPLPPLGDMAVIQSPDAARWKGKKNCQIHRSCPHPVQKLPSCARGGGGTEARPVMQILAAAPALAGQIVRARGALGVGESMPNPPSGSGRCDPATACCGWSMAHVVIGGDTGTLALFGLFCGGDKSRVCCNAPAYGQTVVATGRLEPARAPTTVSQPGTGWQLTSASVCEEQQSKGDR